MTTSPTKKTASTSRQGKPTPAAKNAAADATKKTESEPHRHSCACGWQQPIGRTSGAAKLAWTYAERQALSAMIAEHGPYQGCKLYAAAHPERTALGCAYQWTNAIKGKMEAAPRVYDEEHTSGELAAGAL